MAAGVRGACGPSCLGLGRAGRPLADARWPQGSALRSRPGQPA